MPTDDSGKPLYDPAVLNDDRLRVLYCYDRAGSSTTINGGQILASGGSSGMGRAVSALGDVTITGGYFYAGGSSGAGDNYMNAISMFYDGVLPIRPAEGKTVTVISETDYAVSTMYNAKVYIYGGSFACNGSRTDVLDFESAGNVQIYSGTFKHEPYADYLPEGYIAVEEESGYVVQAAQPAADLTVNSYEELAGALNGSVLEPKRITLGADMTIPAGADLTLQQGYTLTVPADVTLTVNGILSLDSTMTNDGTLTVGAQGFVEHPLNLTNNGTITDYPAVENGVCTISTPMQLQWLSCLVEWDNGNIPASVRLAGDIAMPNVEFTPIGSSSFYHGSTFDGGNHTISDLQVVVTSEYRGGLFGNVGDVTVRNLTISGTSTNSTNARSTT